jgi:tetratricopeptide (TPR) repeat protein
VEETARGLAAAPHPSAPAVEAPASGGPRSSNEVDDATRAKEPPPAEPSRPRISVTSAQREAEAKTRREMLARRLTGNGARPQPPTAPAAPSATHAKTADAVDALKRRYEERLLAAKTSQAKKYAESGMAARAKGDVIAAANALRVAVTFDESNADLKAAYEDAQRASDQLLAEQYTKQADYEEKAERWPDAARSWQRVARAKENDAKAHERAAHCLVKANGNLHEASKLAQRAVQLNPKSAHAHVVLANVYLAAGLGKNGKRELEAALALAPNDHGIAVLLKRIGKSD